MTDRRRLAVVGNGMVGHKLLETVADLQARSGTAGARWEILQDTNDHFLANLQRDGSYSVVPRIPGGEVTPEGLITIGEVARDFGLYTKITGGQRVDLFGARVGPSEVPPGA